MEFRSQILKRKDRWNTRYYVQVAYVWDPSTGYRQANASLLRLAAEIELLADQTYWELTVNVRKGTIIIHTQYDHEPDAQLALAVAQKAIGLFNHA